MLDPFFLPPPPFLAALTAPIARALNLSTLPLHIHEVLIAFAFYHFVSSYGAPWISAWLVPTKYAAFNARTKLNWDIHVVSFVQSCLINFLALWVMYTDEERKGMDWRGRVYGYTGASAMIQGFAAGYFLWDLCISVMHVDVFGWGMLAHAVSALVVFSLGFRPFVNFYAPTFILYELSSPFLNIHWFCDKLALTGSKLQLYNGLLLLATFFSCRLVWGTYQSIRVYQDVWAAIQSPNAFPVFANTTSVATNGSLDADTELFRFHQDEMVVPVWLACTYLGSNIVLNTLNFYWFGKMVEAVKKRFRPTKKEKVEMKAGSGVRGSKEGPKVEMDGHGHAHGRGKKVTEVKQTEIRRRKG